MPDLSITETEHKTMRIRPVDNIIPIVEHPTNENRDQPQKRRQHPKDEDVPATPVYKPNGELEEPPPPKIDVLV
jgi:hypothetical protein